MIIYNNFISIFYFNFLFQFIVFLPQLRLTSRITIRDNLDNYEKRQYKVFLFSDEEKFKKKIRL